MVSFSTSSLQKKYHFLSKEQTKSLAFAFLTKNMNEGATDTDWMAENDRAGDFISVWFKSSSHSFICEYFCCNLT